MRPRTCDEKRPRGNEIHSSRNFIERFVPLGLRARHMSTPDVIGTSRWKNKASRSFIRSNIVLTNHQKPRTPMQNKTEQNKAIGLSSFLHAHDLVIVVESCSLSVGGICVMCPPETGCLISKKAKPMCFSSTLCPCCHSQRREALPEELARYPGTLLAFFAWLSCSLISGYDSPVTLDLDLMAFEIRHVTSLDCQAACG